jgi:2-C-methyl-D-erythritol 4-phosphate cytidylyltransferase/2-C-methyl-D-erythritol 2,4-cyclodiphosphate synthase
VRLGVEAALPCRYVLVHDAARPFAPAALVDAVAAATLRHGAAVPVLPVGDTVKEDDGNGFCARTLDRGRLRLAQTPQGARADWLLEALDRALEEGTDPTDEAQALELAGRRVAFVPGDPSNAKITAAPDLEAARLRTAGDPAVLRVGTGFDIHRFGEGRPLVLGGVDFPGEPGLLGHSDADVVLHAAMDALLGAAALGDIGVHFPPGDPRFAGAASTGLARDVAALLRGQGFEIVNLDLTVLAERPRIRERSLAMREEIARCFGLDPSRVGMKATTLEGLGALGRGEGIACQAVALLRESRGPA